VDGDEDDGQPNAAVAVMRAASTTVRPPRTGPGREGALMAPETVPRTVDEADRDGDVHTKHSGGNPHARWVPQRGHTRL